MENNEEGGILTFREIKKRMTEESVLKNKLEGKTHRIRERYAGIEPGSDPSSSNLSEVQEEIESGVEEDDLFMIIRKDNNKELLVNGGFVLNPDAFNSKPKSSSSSSYTSAESRRGSATSIHKDKEPKIEDGFRNSIAVQAGSGFNNSIAVQAGSGFNNSIAVQAGSSLLEPESLLPSTSKACKFAYNRPLPSDFLVGDRLAAGASKDSKDSDKDEDKVKDNSSEGEESSSEDSSSSSSNKSSDYSDSKDVLKKTILKYGEVGPKRLEQEPTLPQPHHPRLRRRYEAAAKQKTKRSALPTPPLIPSGQHFRPLPLQPSAYLNPPQKNQENSQQQNPKTKKDKPKNFITYVNSRNFVSKGTKKDKNSHFQYDLSDVETRMFTTNKKKPMKDVPEKEKKLLTEGQRKEYLDVRYTQGPVSKYHYPEATSWRYGWAVDQTKNPRS